MSAVGRLLWIVFTKQCKRRSAKEVNSSRLCLTTRTNTNGRNMKLDIVHRLLMREQTFFVINTSYKMSFCSAVMVQWLRQCTVNCSSQVLKPS